MDRQGNRPLNALKHGGCTKRVLVKDEKQEDFDAMQAWWVLHYDAEECRPGVEEAGLNEWLLHRTQRNYLAVEEWLGESQPWEWTEEQIHRLNLMTRYKTAAERSFHRSLAAVERFRRTRVYEAMAQGRMAAQTEERERKRRKEEPGPKGPTELQRLLALPPVVKVPLLAQWVTVTQDGENTVTSLKPSNEQLLQDAETMDPKPVRVCRHLFMNPWLATEYAWVADLPGTGTTRRQVMTFAEWEKALTREKDTPGGHVGPAERDPSWKPDSLGKDAVADPRPVLASEPPAVETVDLVQEE